MSHEVEKASGRPDEVVPRHEEGGMRTMYSDIDKEVVNRLSDRYEGVVPPERLQKLKDLPIAFENRREFGQSIKDAGSEPPQGSEVLGFVRENSQEQPHVALDQGIESVAVTAAHERLHQLADPAAKESLGPAIYEGTTEFLARDVVGPMSESALADRSHVYKLETALAQNLKDVAGQDTVESAYLKGDVETLRSKVDESLGKGSLESFGAEVREWEDLPRSDQ